jgi:AcrR family transcriptional regulator
MDPGDRAAGRPTLRDRQKAMTRALLRDAALELFSAKGYAQTTIDDVTSAVGTSRATFYLHFDGKARILAEAWDEQVMVETLDYYRRLDAFGIPDQDQLRGWLDDALGFYERHRDILRVGHEARSIEPDLVQLSASHTLHRCTEAMPGYLGRWRGAERERARLRLELLILALSDFAVLWVDGHWPVKRDTALDVLLELWTGGLRIAD